jgi:hypothetical protein
VTENHKADVFRRRAVGADVAEESTVHEWLASRFLVSRPTLSSLQRRVDGRTVGATCYGPCTPQAMLPGLTARGASA